MKNNPFILSCFLLVFALVPSWAEWSLYDGFDYSAKLLDGADSGEGPWTSYWRPSMDGGVEIESGALAYKDRFAEELVTTGGHTYLESSSTAGAYRDFVSQQAGDKEVLVFWVSFLAQAKGAPFSSSGDEISVQLRSADNIDWVSFGVMGRLDAWRIRLSDGSRKVFSEGAAGIYTDDVNFFVARIRVDLREGQPDAVTLWVNPPLGGVPHDSTAVLDLAGEDFWKAGLDLSFTRLRIGVVNSGAPEAKVLVLDEMRLGERFDLVAPRGK